MTKRTISKQIFGFNRMEDLVSVFEISNFEFIWDLVLVICFFAVKSTIIMIKRI